jgi:hypothetical protein
MLSCARGRTRDAICTTTEIAGVGDGIDDNAKSFGVKGLMLRGSVGLASLESGYSSLLRTGFLWGFLVQDFQRVSQKEGD